MIAELKELRRELFHGFIAVAPLKRMACLDDRLDGCELFHGFIAAGPVGSD